MITCIFVILALSNSREKSKEQDAFVVDGDILYEAAWDAGTDSEKLYQVIKGTDDAKRLFVNGIYKKEIDYGSNETALDFDTKKDKASADLLSFEDGDEDEIGNHIFHSQKSYSEKYFRYLVVEEGYSVSYYTKTTDFFDAFLESADGKPYRFLYIMSSGDIGTTIFSELEDGVEYPESFEDSIDFNTYSILSHD
jgi:hypothetical protein